MIAAAQRTICPENSLPVSRSDARYGAYEAGDRSLTNRYDVRFRCLDAERALRGVSLGRKSWLFAGSDRGGERAAIMYALVQTARLNGVDPQAWLADVFARINDHKIADIAALLPWNWAAEHKHH